uniref:Carcinoembryonic antigen-related cell adhesion molecule 5-like n=1 Tax=Rhinopithecus roxellana TaxID=61622 RepID=A0A2K6Q6I4_RHIRO
MGSPSVPPYRWCIPWQRLLLTASLLTFWNPPTTAQLTIESRPFNVTEGKEVLLLAHNLPQNLLGYIWYKGERVDANGRIGSHVIGNQQTTPGPAHSGRETIYSNASLLIQNVTQNDTGSYTLQAIKEDLVNEEATGQFRVYVELPKPYIISNNSNPVEDKDAVTLTCEPETQDTTYLWWINNQSLPVSPRLELSSDNRTLTLLNVPRNDTAFYECETQNPVSVRRSDAVTLNVLSELPKPYITSNNSNPVEDKDAVTLTCGSEAQDPTYLWWVNGQSLLVSPRLQLSNGNRTLTLLNVTRNDTGRYECGIQDSVSAKRSSPVTLNVLYGPDTPIISPPDLSYNSGANLNLSCHADSNPSPQYSWLINGTLQQHTKVLFISKITSNNNGAYACFVSNLDTGRNNSIVKNISVSSGSSAPGNSGLSARATVGIIIGVLVGVALI